MSVPVTAYVALGANLGDARATVNAAIEALDHLPQTRLLRASTKLAGLKALMHGKYGDIILLCSVMLAFLVMLALSAAG